MIRLTIDGVACDVAPDTLLPFGYDAARLSDPSAAREGRSMTLTLPATDRNDALFGPVWNPRAACRFNRLPRTAELSVGGAVLLCGTARLLRSTPGEHTVELREGGADWAEQAALGSFADLPVTWEANLTPTAVRDGWRDGSPVKFFPVLRDSYDERNSSSDLLVAERILTPDDYHPFLHVETLLRAIVEGAGYTLASRFAEGELFRSLYLSGAYASRDVTALRRRMDFLARRRTTVTAEADSAGRVYATPFGADDIVGDIVETATPGDVDEEGETLADLFNNGGCFRIEEGKICFRPTVAVSVGFEYYLRYTTDHRIVDRTTLAGFDGIYLGTGSDVRFTLANRYPDRRGPLRSGFGYRAIVFGHEEGARYRLTYTAGGVAGVTWAEFSSRSVALTTPASGSFDAPVLHLFSGGAWIPYGGDWALYDGYVGETGRTTVELRLRTAPEPLSPSSPKRFNTIYFYGADPGMAFTLHKECTLKPRFTSRPGYGARIAFADAACIPGQQILLIEALQHLFNLRFYTDGRTKTLYMEPYDDFCDAGRVTDWSGRTSSDDPFVLTDIAPEVHESRLYGYPGADGAVTRFNAGASRPFGDWSVVLDTFAAKQGLQTLRNPLFQATLSEEGGYAEAPSARIMRVGDRDAADSDDESFEPRIVRYAGMRPLAGDERWGYPETDGSYPLAAFHFPGDGATEGFSLCFEDRDGLRGLHRFYDAQLAEEASGRRITVTLRADPWEIASLFTGGEDRPPGVLGLFRFTVGGMTLTGRLHRLISYDPQRRLARCIFAPAPCEAD